RSLPALVICANVLLSASHAQNWPGWRGPEGTGKSTEKNLPTNWDRETNVRWKVDLPERGNSTPVVWGDQVFVTQAIEKDGTRSLICFDRKTGKEMWQAGTKYAGTEATHKTNPYCSPSPVTDGERVIVWYGSAGLFCYDMKGRELWSRDLGPQKHIWGVGSSPILYGDLCILSFGPGTNEFIIAVNKKTGETVWKVDQMPLEEELKLSGPANNGSVSPDRDSASLEKKLRGSWATPLVIKAGGRDELIVPLPRRVSAFDPATGKKLWTCGGLGPLTYGSPTWGEGILIAMGGYHSASLAVRPGGSGDVTKTHRVWHRPKSSLRLGTGIIHDGHWYVSDMKSVVECIELKSGKSIWKKRLSGSGGSGDVWGSITMSGDGLLYMLNQSGDTFVLRASPEFEQIAKNSLGETSNSSVTISNGDLFLRTHNALWCIGRSE
ncbi:MAG: PQQ-binding-like beta-propeller repeat protein, partial [Pirellulales bacterium]|nr:PQQ-binding-like beta-propeller repeat protein [Pirellulales bacterium]